MADVMMVPSNHGLESRFFDRANVDEYPLERSCEKRLRLLRAAADEAEEQNAAAFGAFPDALVHFIFSKLDERDKCKVLYVCRRWRTWALDTACGWAHLRLTSASGGWIQGLDEDALNRLVAGRFGNVQRVTFEWGNSVSSAAIFRLLGHRPTLIELDVSGCDLSDASLAVVASCGSTLRTFRAGMVPRLTEAGLAALLVGCTGLRTLALPTNRIRHVPATLGGLTLLEHLDLRGNEIQVLPDAVGQLHVLETLCLAANQISALPRALCALPRLRAVDLSKNEATLLDPAAAAGVTSSLPPSVTSLDLSFQRCAALALPARLEQLTLKGTVLSPPALVRELAKLDRLTALRLPSCALEALPVLAGPLLARLELLDLSSNFLRELPPAVLQMVRLERLVLHGNSLASLPAGLAGMGALRRLDVSKNALTELPTALPAGLEALTAYGNKLVVLPSLPSMLRELAVQQNVLASLGAEFAALADLESLDVSRNKLRTVRALPPGLTRLVVDRKTSIPPVRPQCEVVLWG